MSLILSLIHSEIPSVLDEECTCAYCGYFLTASETDICNRCRKDLKRKITKISCNEKLYKITGTKRRTILKEEPWLQQELRTANAEEIKEVSEQKAFLEKYFLQNGVEMKYIDEYCKLKKLTFESFISNLKLKIKKLGDYECNYTDNLIKLFYFCNEGVSPSELIERFQKCLNDKEFLNDQEFLYNYFFQYKVQMEDIVKYCKYEKQINLESFISDLKSKIKKLWDTQYNYSGKRRVKIGVKKLIQLFYLRNEGVSRLKCIELFQNCLDDYLEKFKQCKQECMVNIMRLRDEDIEHVGKKKLRPAKEESHKSYSPNFTSSASEKVKVNEANLEVTHINEANLETTDKLRPAKEESQKSCSPNFTSSAPGKVKVNEANLEVAHINEANLEATNKLRPAKEESQKSCSPNFTSSAPGKLKANEANLEVTHINKANLETTGIKKANLEATDMNETNLEVTYRNEPSNSNNQIFFYYEENASTNNSDDQNDENAFTKKSNASEKLFGPHSVSKNNKIEDEHLFSKLAADFLGMDFSTRQNNSFRKTNIVSKKLADIDNNASEINKNDKFSIARKGDEISVKRTSDITTQKTLSSVCTNDVKDGSSSRVISIEQISGNMQKDKKSEDSIENDIRKKGNKNETLLKHDIDAQKIIKNAEISHIASQKKSAVVCKDIKEDVSSKIISVERTDGNIQKERKSGDFSIDNDSRKKDSKKETLLKRDIDAQKIIKNAEISDTALQKESSIVCKHNIKEDVSSRIISVQRTDGKIQKERKSGDFSIDNDTRKNDSKKETHLKRDIDAQEIIKNVEISDSKSQKTSIIPVEQTDGNMQKERKSGDFNIYNDIIKKDSENDTLLKHDIDTQKIIKNAEISDTASQKDSSVVCKHDIKEDVSSKIISVERTDGNIQKEKKSGDLSVDDDTRKKDSKKETLLKRDIDAQKIIKNVEISDSKSKKTSIISVEQTDGNMQKERKSRDFNIDSDIRKKDSKNETILKRNIDTQKIIKNAEISDTASQKESSIVCKHDIKEDVSSRIISVEQTDGNIQKKRKLGDFSIDDDTRKKDSKKETLLKRDIDDQKIIKNVEISDSKSQKTSIISVEQTDGNMQKERKSGDFNIDNDIRKKDSKKETLLKRGIYIEKIIKNAEISDIASQKESSIVCKHDIKEDVSSRIISVELTDENRQKKRKREDLKNDLKNKNNASQRLTDIDNNAPESNKNEIFSIARKGAEVSIKRTLDITTQKTPSSVCTNDVKDDASSRIISIEQINRNRQKERKSEDFSMENDIRKKGSKNETHDIDAQKIIKDAEISHIASQKESSVVYKKDIKEDVSSKIISVERTDGNIQKERKSGDFSIDNDIRKKDSKNETVLKRDIDAQEIIKNDEISDSKSQKTSSVVCKNGIKDMSSRVISVEQIDDNIQKERKSEEFNIHNAIRKEGSQNKTLLKYDIDTQKIINNAEISDISQKKSLVVCKHDIKEDMSSRIISVEPTDENRQKRSKREEFNDLKNKNNASQRLTESSKDFQIAACTQPRLATRTDNEDDAQSRIITVSVLCLGDQKEVKISTERNDSKFISDGNEKTLTKIYEFIFNFKKSGSLFKCPYRRTSHSVISGDPTGQSAGPPRIIYRTEISCFLPDKQMPSIKDCIDFLRKNSNEFREYVDKANEKHLLKKFDLRTSAGISEDTDFCEEELRSKKQKERPSILRLFGYEKSEPVELELSDKQEVIKQKISHLFISTPSDDVSHMSKGQSQNSNSGIPFIAHDEHKSIFSEKSKHPDKSREVSSVSQRSPSKDKYDYVPSPDKEEMTELAEKILPCDIDPMVHNKQFFEDVSIEDLLKDFKLDDDLNEAYSSNFLSANIDELCGQNYAKSSHKPESYHDYETASQDSDTFSVYSDFDSVFDSVSPNLLDESLSWDNI